MRSYKSYSIALSGKLNRMWVVALAFPIAGILSVFGLYSLGAMSHSGNTGSTSAPSQLQVSDDTARLLNVLNDLNNGSAAQKSKASSQIAGVTEARKATFLEIMKSNPQEAIEGAVPTAMYSQLPADIRQHVEQHGKIKGTFQYVYLDDFNGDKSTVRHFVKEEGTDKRYQLYLTEKDVKAKTGDKVTVSGIMMNDQIAANTADLSIVEPVTASTITSRKVAVILFNWQNDQRTTFTTDSARSAYFTAPNSTNAFFKENSFGKTELVGKLRADGDVFGWFTIPRDNTNCSLHFDLTWQPAADAAAEAAGVDLSGYDHISYVFPPVSDCGFTGSAQQSGPRSWINGTNQGTITHEIGHNLGSHHASSWSCTDSNGVRVAISSFCTTSEYGDPFSVMGQSSGNRHFHNHEKELTTSGLDWLEPSNTHTVNRTIAPDNSYTVTPIEQASTGIQSLRIPLGNTTSPETDDFYYVEFRQPFGFDNFSASSAVVNGITIRSARDYISATQSKLIDTTPTTTSYVDAPLMANKTFSDPAKGINISLVSASPSGANVQVWFNPASCTRANPTLTVTPTSSSIMAGQSVSYSYTIKNNDVRACPNSTFNLAPALPSGITQSPASASHTLRPGSSASGTFIITSSGNVAPGTYTVAETAHNVAASVMKSTVNLNVIINSNNDTAAPVITILSPANGAKITKTLKIDASASDQTGVAHIKLLLDGVVVKTCAGVTTCTYSVAGSTLAAGAHVVTVEATDTLGLGSSKSVNITR